MSLVLSTWGDFVTKSRWHWEQLILLTEISIFSGDLLTCKSSVVLHYVHELVTITAYLQLLDRRADFEAFCLGLESANANLWTTLFVFAGCYFAVLLAIDGRARWQQLSMAVSKAPEVLQWSHPDTLTVPTIAGASLTAPIILLILSRLLSINSSNFLKSTCVFLFNWNTVKNVPQQKLLGSSGCWLLSGPAPSVFSSVQPFFRRIHEVKMESLNICPVPKPIVLLLLSSSLSPLIEKVVINSGIAP